MFHQLRDKSPQINGSVGGFGFKPDRRWLVHGGMTSSTNFKHMKLLKVIATAAVIGASFTLVKPAEAGWEYQCQARGGMGYTSYDCGRGGTFNQSPGGQMYRQTDSNIMGQPCSGGSMGRWQC